MMKTSYSSIFNEGLDFSCVIFDRDGEMVAYAEFCPAQIGAILYTMQWTIAEIGLENFKPGDVVMHNDPYRGGCHMPEHTVIQAVYHNGELYGFIGNIAHVTEIGGKAVGGFAADAKEVYQEGLRLPPIKIIREGEPVEDIWKIILENHRTPRTSWGDFHAMLGSLTVAERRLHELLDRYGFDEILTAGKQLMDYSEARMRAEIRDIPNGEYQFDDWIENDGVVPDKRYRINCTAIVDDENILFDYTDSSPQARGPCNCTYGVTASATFNAMLNITDQTIPRNSGCYRPIQLIVPPGTVVNVKHPGPSVGGNSEIHERIVDVLFGCLSGAVPERVAAATGASSCNFLFGGIHPNTGQYYANYHIDGCGWGGKATGDGNHTQCPINGNCRNTPVEVFETRYPWIDKNISHRRGFRADTVSIVEGVAAKGLLKHSHRKSRFRVLWIGMRQGRGGYLVDKKERAAQCGFGKMEMTAGEHSPRSTVQPHPTNSPTFKFKPAMKLELSVREVAGTDRLKIANRARF